MNFYQYAMTQFFKSARTRQSPWVIGLWAGATVFSYLRKRTTPQKVRMTRKGLKPGASYVVRVPKGSVDTDLSAISSRMIVDTPVSARRLRKLEKESRR